VAPAPLSEDITALLAEIEEGGPGAAEQLWQAIYPNLRRIAHHALRHRRSGHSLNTTALVNEAYLKLVPHQHGDWSGRLHFFSVAATAMRHILIDHARQRGRQKRGGGQVPVSLDDAVLVAEERAGTLLALDEALTRLASRDERLARVVEYRFFGGLTEEEIGDLLHVTERTVRRDWCKAKAWLALALSDPPSA
jgi:RNA polymerase sigma factor (TIGR02999 family)